MAKCYEELQFTDDFMFGKVMEDKELCRDVLECLLDEPVGELRDVHTEKQLRYTADGKPIRLDVYTRDHKSVYDAEMQNLNHRRLEELELPKRSRFYQSMMDVDYLQKGGAYQSLPDGKVLIICTFDPFGKGKAKYVFENRCEDKPELSLRDGTAKIFYNCTCLSREMPEGLRAFYDFILTGASSSALTRRIASAVDRARRNEEWRSDYMKELLLRADARAEGRAEAIRGFVQDKLEDGIDRETIIRKLEKVYSMTREEAEKYLL